MQVPNRCPCFHAYHPPFFSFARSFLSKGYISRGGQLSRGIGVRFTLDSTPESEGKCLPGIPAKSERDCGERDIPFHLVAESHFIVLLSSCLTCRRIGSEPVDGLLLGIVIRLFRQKRTLAKASIAFKRGLRFYTSLRSITVK